MPSRPAETDLGNGIRKNLQNHCFQSLQSQSSAMGIEKTYEIIAFKACRVSLWQWNKEKLTKSLPSRPEKPLGDRPCGFLHECDRQCLQAIKSCGLVEHLAKTNSISRAQQLPGGKVASTRDSFAAKFELTCGTTQQDLNACGLWLSKPGKPRGTARLEKAAGKATKKATKTVAFGVYVRVRRLSRRVRRSHVRRSLLFQLLSRRSERLHVSLKWRSS